MQKKIIEYITSITVSCPENIVSEAKKEINKLYFGFPDVNTINKNGTIVEKEEVKNSPNKPMVEEAHRNLHAVSEFKVKVSIMSDGSKTIEVL